MEKKNEYEGFRFSDLCVVIKVSANSMDDIKEIVKQTAEIQKEYSCYCTPKDSGAGTAAIRQFEKAFSWFYL